MSDKHLKDVAPGTELSQHVHKWVYLRQEERNIGYDRNPTWETHDVFFCEQCLSYERVFVKREMPSQTSFGRVRIG